MSNEPNLKKASGAGNLSWRERLNMGLLKSRNYFGGGIRSLFGSNGRVNEDWLMDLEELLLLGDVGIEATTYLIDQVKLASRAHKIDTPEALSQALREALYNLLQPLEQPLDVTTHKPFITLISGVNGAGKTTSIGKLARYYQNQGKSVLLAAGDTFRAAAREQLQRWGAKNQIDVIAQSGGDPAAVVFDAVNAAKARGVDILLADTAGRLPTQAHLMDEMAKVRRVIAKSEPTAPHESLLVLDANTGQNTLQQIHAFDQAIGVSGLILTKLDGTPKGGVIAAIARQCPKPLRFVGVGEDINDLRQFVARDFVEALLT